MQLDMLQKKVVLNKGHMLVKGAAGTGKTTTLVMRVKTLLEAGVPPQCIYVAAFTLRSALHIRALCGDLLANFNPQKLQIGTFRDFALSAIESVEEEELDIADHRHIRRFLRQSMDSVGFDGSVTEAESLIRQFKSRARKPQESEQYYQLFNAFKQLMDESGKTDRYDILRMHIVGMRNDVYQPCAMRYLLIDNIQDLTQVQFLWLFEHMKSGAEIAAFGDPDICLFENDGAVGTAAFRDFEQVEGISVFTLDKQYRNPAIAKIVSGVFLQDLKKHEVDADNSKRNLQFIKYHALEQELEGIAQRLDQVVAAGHTCGVLVANDYQARRVSRYLSQRDILHVCTSPSLWDAPGAITIIDFLEVLLNSASDGQLRNVLHGFGLNNALIHTLFENGLVPRDWLKNRAPLPAGLTLPNAALQEFAAVQRMLVGYYTLLTQRESKPKEVFMAAAYDFISLMREEDRRDALLAIENLLELKGSLASMLPKIRDYRSPNLEKAKIVVSSIREVRNREYDLVIVPFVAPSVYPDTSLRYLPQTSEQAAQLLYYAAMRSRQEVYFSTVGEWNKQISTLAASVQQKAA